MNIKRSLAGEDDTHGKETVEFQVERGRADAAADLAADLSAQFLEGATSGEDVSELAMQGDEAEERNVGFRVETMDAYPIKSLPLDVAANAPDANSAAIDAELRADSAIITDVIDDKDILSEDVITSVGEVTPAEASAGAGAAKPASSKPRPPPRKRSRRPRAPH